MYYQSKRRGMGAYIAAPRRPRRRGLGDIVTDSSGNLINMSRVTFDSSNPFIMNTDPALQTQFDRADVDLAPVQQLTAAQIAARNASGVRYGTPASQGQSWFSQELISGSKVSNGVALAGAGLLVALAVFSGRRR